MTDRKLRFHLDIDPMPAPRPRFRVIQPKRGGRPIASAYNPKEYTDWSNHVAAELRELMVDQEPMAGAVTVGMIVSVKRPKSTKLDAPKPDIDNYAKAVLDAMTKAGVWDDDTQVQFLGVKKQWDDEGSVSIEVQSGVPL